MFKMSCPFYIVYSQYKTGQDFLDTQYYLEKVNLDPQKALKAMQKFNKHSFKLFSDWH